MPGGRRPGAIQLSSPTIIAAGAPTGDRILRGILFAVLTFALFAGMDATVKWLSADYAVGQIVFIVAGTALVPVGLFVAGNGGLRALKPRSPGRVWLRAALVAASTLCTLQGFASLPLAEGYAIAFTVPLLVTVLSVPLLREAVGIHRWPAVAVGFAGVIVMLRPGFQTLAPGHFLMIASALLFASSLIVLRRLGRSESGPALIVTLLACLLLLTGPLAVAAWKTPDAAALGLMLLAGLAFGSGHAFLVLAFREAPAALVSPFHYTQILWALFYGAWLFGDRPDPVTLAGASVVIASGLYTLWRETRRSR